MSMMGLGRRFVPDEHDKRHLMSRRVAAAENRKSRYHLSRGKPLDQGATSECVIYSIDKYLTTNPVCNKSFGSAEVRTKVYKEVQKLDVWEGEDYDGTSVRAGMKWLKNNGLITGYNWGFDLEPVILHLLGVGPVVLGTDWTFDMFMPGEAKGWEGYIFPGGEIVGGHAYLAVGCNREKRNPDGTKGAILCLNSWGLMWGKKGYFWLTFRDAEQLIKADGEAATPAEVKLLKPLPILLAA